MSDSHLLDGRLKLRHLVLVTAIAEQGSIVAAAESVFVTQPVVTRALRDLEEILGVELFERGPRGVTPTPYGLAFVEHARAVLAQIRQAERQIDLLANAELGSVTVGTHLAGSNLLLPRAIAMLKSEHPGLTVVVREATPDTLRTELLSGACDLIVGRLDADPPSSMVQHLMYFEPIRPVARVEHPVHDLDGPDLARLADYPWIFPVEQTALRAELEQAFLSQGAQLPSDRIECTSILTLRELLVSTDVIAALPMLIVSQDEKLKFIDTPLTGIRRSVGVTLPADRPLSPATRALMTHLAQVADGLNPELDTVGQATSG